VWNAIDQHLDKNKVVDINKKYIQLKRVAAALLILLIGIGAYTLNTWNKAESLTKTNNLKKISIQKNDAGTSTNVPPKKEKITLADTANTVNKINTTNSIAPDHIVIKRLQNKVAPLTANDISKNSIAENPGTEKHQENIITTGNNKIAIKKRTYKTTIANARIGDDANDEMVKENESANDNKPEIEMLPKALPAINPELLKGANDNGLKNKTAVGNYILPADLLAKAHIPEPFKIRKTASFSATAFFAPNLSSNTVKEETHERRPGGRVNDRDREKIKEGEQHQFSYSFGLLLDYNLNKHWSVESGIIVTNKTIDISPKTIFAHKDNSGAVKYLFDCSSGYLLLSTKSGIAPIEGDSIRALPSTNTLQYISVPLSVKYNFPFNNKLDVFASAGTSVNILSKGKIETGIQNGSTKEASVSTNINGLKSNYLGGNLSVGLTYNITDKIGLSFNPAYNFAVTPSTKDAAVKSYPNAISLAAGIRFKL
jgi:hypothetical protein